MSSPRRQALVQRWQQVQAMQGEGYPPSPCLSVCVMNPQTGWCEGCLRNLDEIAVWGGASLAQQHAIWQRIGERLNQATQP
jgi:predicted Fe-S protein YdhL (DUF1289 family)